MRSAEHNQIGYPSVPELEERVELLEAENRLLKALLNKAYNDHCGCLGSRGDIDAT